MSARTENQKLIIKSLTSCSALQEAEHQWKQYMMNRLSLGYNVLLFPHPAPKDSISIPICFFSSFPIFWQVNFKTHRTDCCTSRASWKLGKQLMVLSKHGGFQGHPTHKKTPKPPKNTKPKPDNMSSPAKYNDLFLSQKFKFSPPEIICIYKEKTRCVLQS